eukprot:COSAG01_NODE_27132_length_693_cov_1.385522_1_plen_30_part_10
MRCVLFSPDPAPHSAFTPSCARLVAVSGAP